MGVTEERRKERKKERKKKKERLGWTGLNLTGWLTDSFITIACLNHSFIYYLCIRPSICSSINCLLANLNEWMNNWLIDCLIDSFVTIACLNIHSFIRNLSVRRRLSVRLSILKLLACLLEWMIDQLIDRWIVSFFLSILHSVMSGHHGRCGCGT